MKSIFNILTGVLILSIFAACGSSDEGLKSGIWRATLKTDSAVEIPFNFEIADSAGQKIIHIINGKERFRVDEISFSGDSVIIEMPLFDSRIRAKSQNGTLTGKWIKRLTDKNVSMDFEAKADQDWRFVKIKKDSKYNPGGRWSVAFTSQDNRDTTIAVGEFVNENGKLTGTFLTSTGDYRFLEGTVSGDNIYLSCFDGSHAYLFTGKMKNDNTIVDGKFYAGYSGRENWTAKRDDKAILPDAYSLTSLKKGYDKISFSFPSIDGKNVSLDDEKFRNKVVLIQFFGSWCPNCMDETAYLVPFYEKYKSKGLEIVALAYERTTDFERSRANVERMRKRFNVPYYMLVTGFTNDKEEVAKSLPMLNNFVAFPTLITVDKKGVVRKIHTGFSGPGTGKHYTDFVEEFEQSIDELLAEK